MWKLNSDAPIYLQLIEYLQNRIVTGDYPPASQIPSVRDLAYQAGVNPNTMQKALVELERTGLVTNQRTAGRFVTEDSRLIKQTRHQLANQTMIEFEQAMTELGYNKQETLDLLQKHNYVPTDN